MSLFLILLSVFFIVLNAHWYIKDKSNIAVVLIGLWCISLGVHISDFVSSIA